MSRKKGSGTPREPFEELSRGKSTAPRTDAVTGDLLRRKPKKRKPRTDEQEELTSTEKLVVICDEASTYRLFEDLPEWQPGDFGRPRLYPNCVFAVLECLREVWPHARTVSRELKTPQLFQAVCDGIEKHVGPAEAEVLRATGKMPSRATWARFTARAEASGYDPRTVLQQTGLAHAIATDHFDDQVRFNYSNPRPPDFTFGDGTVFKSPTDNRYSWATDPVTGERHQLRIDPATGIYREAGGTRVRGTKFVMVQTRAEGYRRQFILDAAHLPYRRPGGEMQLGVEMWEGLKNQAPGIRGLVWDGAMRGVHHERIASRGGLGVAPSIAESVEDAIDKGGKRRSRRKEKSLALGSYTGDGCRHALYGIAGQAHELKVTDDGTEQQISLVQRPQFRAAPCPGHYYLYLLVTIPCGRAEGGIHEHRIPLTGPGADKLLGGRKISLMEYLRPYAPSDDENSPYRTLYRLRPSAEAANSVFDRGFHFKRMPAYGAYRQTMVVVGISMGRNAIARYLEERRRAQAPPGQQAAA